MSFFQSVQWLSSGETLQIEIQVAKAARVQGKIMTEDTRQPVAFTRVSLRDPDTGADEGVVTDSTGQYETFLHPGKYTVQVFDMRKSMLGDEYTYPELSKVTVSSTTEALTVPDILCPRLARETVKLIDRQGKPLANRKIAILGGTNHS